MILVFFQFQLVPVLEELDFSTPEGRAKLLLVVVNLYRLMLVMKRQLPEEHGGLQMFQKVQRKGRATVEATTNRFVASCALSTRANQHSAFSNHVQGQQTHVREVKVTHGLVRVVSFVALVCQECVALYRPLQRAQVAHQGARRFAFPAESNRCSLS